MAAVCAAVLHFPTTHIIVLVRALVCDKSLFVTNCQVDGETMACVLTYAAGHVQGMGLDCIGQARVVIVRHGTIRTHKPTATVELLAAVQAAMSAPLPETHVRPCPTPAWPVAPGGLVIVGSPGAVLKRRHLHPM